MSGEKDWRRVLITGASSGIGEAYAQLMAPRCELLTVIARRGDRLSALAKDLRSSAPRCDVEVVEADLMTSAGLARVTDYVSKAGALDVLVNNAGYSTVGPFSKGNLTAELGMVRLHQDATLTLTMAALPAMIEARAGAVINVASLGAFVAAPGLATYAATKAFLVSFSRSLHAEVSGMGVKVQCLCPGYTRTEMHSRESLKGFDVNRIPDYLWMDREAVVSASLAALDSNEPVLVPGAANRALVRDALKALMDSIPA